jgi:hypothetical protein
MLDAHKAILTYWSCSFKVNESNVLKFFNHLTFMQWFLNQIRKNSQIWIGGKIIIKFKFWNKIRF